jgi:hypothetical protein
MFQDVIMTGILKTFATRQTCPAIDHALSVAHECLVVIASDPGRDGHVLLYPYQ